MSEQGSWKKRLHYYMNYPKEGVTFIDLMPVLADRQAFTNLVSDMAEIVGFSGYPNRIVCPEARGFILGGAVADRCGIGLVPVRKSGKLPGAVLSESYTLEYGDNVVEMQPASIKPGDCVVVVDDVLATGGTAVAAAKLAARAGAQVIGFVFAVEIEDLRGVDTILEEFPGVPIHSVVSK